MKTSQRMSLIGIVILICLLVFFMSSCSKTFYPPGKYRGSIYAPSGKVAYTPNEYATMKKLRKPMGTRTHDSCYNWSEMKKKGFRK